MVIYEPLSDVHYPWRLQKCVKGPALPQFWWRRRRWSVRFGAMPSTRTLATNLLPLGHGLQLRDVSIGSDQIVATLEATAPRGTCPRCGTGSEAVHSHYQRTIADLPWSGQAVRLHLRVRKFYCRQPACTRRVFTERLPYLVAPYARRTARLESVLRMWPLRWEVSLGPGSLSGWG